MKKLLALLVVSGMVFVACNNQPKEEEVVAEEVVEAEATETTPEAAEMPAEAVATETTEAAPAN